MLRQVGKQQGTGTKSETANQSGSCAAHSLITSAFVSRSSGSKTCGARVRDRLEGDARDGRVGDAETDDLAHLVLVDAFSIAATSVTPTLAAAQLNRARVASPRAGPCRGRHVRLELEAVELEVDVRL